MDFKKILFKTSSIDVDKALPDAVIFLTKDGKIQWVNDIAAQIFETSKMHLLTSNVSEFIENSNNIIENAASQNKPIITKLKNKELYYDMTVRQIEQGYVLDLREISSTHNLKHTDTDTTVINRDKNNFLIKLSNDLKSPIQSIVGFSQAMSDGLGGAMSEQQEKYVKIINKNSVDLMYFIDKLIELSQTELLQKKPDIKPVDSVSLINSIIKFNEQLYKDKEVKIIIKTEDSYKTTINTDADIFKNIIQDLLEVILRSVDLGEIIINLSYTQIDENTIKGLKQGNYTKISLSSSSLILSESELDCMFDPYKILDSSNRKNVLRAIILASVRNLVQILGGSIWVESQILKSSSFNLLIPKE